MAMSSTVLLGLGMTAVAFDRGKRVYRVNYGGRHYKKYCFWSKLGQTALFCVFFW